MFSPAHFHCHSAQVILLLCHIYFRKTDKFPHSLHFQTSSYLLSTETSCRISSPPLPSPLCVSFWHVSHPAHTTGASELVPPPIVFTSVSLCVTSIHRQAHIYPSLCIALSLLPGGALSGSGANVYELCSVRARLCEACSSYVLVGETFCFSSLLFVLNSQAVLCAPMFLLFTLSISLLHGRHVFLSPGVFCFELGANVCEC